MNEVLTYNGIIVPDRFDVNKIKAGFENAIDNNKLEAYTLIMNDLMLSHPFPEIFGYPSEVDENDVGGFFLNDEEITEDNIGEIIWVLTDGFHRTLSAIATGVPYLDVQLDRSAITSNSDLELYDRIKKYD